MHSGTLCFFTNCSQVLVRSGTTELHLSTQNPVPALLLAYGALEHTISMLENLGVKFASFAPLLHSFSHNGPGSYVT